MRATQLTGPVADHGEGPVWSERWDGLRWVDMFAGDVLSRSADGTIGRRHVGEIAAAIRPRRGGGAVIAVERGFVLEDPDGTLTHLGELWSGGGRMNEGACDPDGRFYCGTFDRERPGTGVVHRLDPDGSTRVVLEGVTASNGLDWSPDGSRAYYIDTDTHVVSRFDYDATAGLTRRRIFVGIPAGAGLPDGLTVDADGGVWVALSGGGAVVRYTPDGVLDGVVAVPTRNVTACTFGGPLLDRLHITTSRWGAPPGDLLAGSLFVAEVGVRGLPVREFAG